MKIKKYRKVSKKPRRKSLNKSRKKKRVKKGGADLYEKQKEEPIIFHKYASNDPSQHPSYDSTGYNLKYQMVQQKYKLERIKCITNKSVKTAIFKFEDGVKVYFFIIFQRRGILIGFEKSNINSTIEEKDVSDLVLYRTRYAPRNIDKTNFPDLQNLIDIIIELSGNNNDDKIFGSISNIFLINDTNDTNDTTIIHENKKIKILFGKVDDMFQDLNELLTIPIYHLCPSSSNLSSNLSSSFSSTEA
jgi:hypothetical protein